MLNGPDWCCSIVAGPDEMTDFKLYTFTFIKVMYYTQSVSAPFKFSYLFLWMTIKMLLRNLTTYVTD
jgi:hypothetical protein